MTFLAFPNISPPNEQIKFETYPGYEWAYRLTNFAKALANAISTQPPGGGGNVSITATFPIIVTPSPITGTGVISHGTSGVTPGIYGDSSNYLVATVDVDGHTTSAQTFPLGITASNLTVVYGDGRDGNVTLDGVSTPSWATRSGSTYTMSDACMCSNLTINAGIELLPKGFPIYVLNTFTCNGTVDARGANDNAAGSAAGGPSNYTSSWTASNVGTAGSFGNANNSVPGSAANSCIGGAGGKGGNGSVGTGAAGGLANRPAIGGGGTKFPATFVLATTAQFSAPPGITYTAAAGGAGGGGDGALPGGGGGGGAGWMNIIARIIAGSGIFKALGGNGANGPTINTGGGGGGGGGVINVVTSTTLWQTLITALVTGGLGGTATGAGTAGTNGAVGRIISLTS